MTKPKAPTLWHRTDHALSVRADADLPPGIAGRVSGIALTYEVVDSYDTMFARGCAKRSVDTRVAARKLPLLMDHDRSTGSHVGVVTAMEDVGNALLMTADLFDTAEGRAALEYVKAVLAADASTGFSIGFIPRRSEYVKIDAMSVERFTEIELREVSITPMPAVPGADVQAARNDTQTADRPTVEVLETAARIALDALPESVRRSIVAAYADVSRPSAPASPDSGTRSSDGPETTPRVLTPDERIAAVRRTYLTSPKG